MEKRILIAVDGSVYSRKAMEYAAGMGSIVKNINYTLLHVHPKVSEYLLEDAKKDPNAMATLRKVTKKNQEDSIRLLDESKNIMVKADIAEDRIETISQEQTRGTAKARSSRIDLSSGAMNRASTTPAEMFSCSNRPAALRARSTIRPTASGY